MLLAILEVFSAPKKRKKKRPAAVRARLLRRVGGVVSDPMQSPCPFPFPCGGHRPHSKLGAVWRCPFLACFCLASFASLLAFFLSGFSGVGAAAVVVVFAVALLFLRLLLNVFWSLVLLLLVWGESAQGVVVVGFRETIISATLETQATIMSPSRYCVASCALLL